MLKQNSKIINQSTMTTFNVHSNIVITQVYVFFHINNVPKEIHKSMQGWKFVHKFTLIKIKFGT